MRSILPVILTLVLGIGCVTGVFYLYKWLGNPAMFLALNPALNGKEGILVSFANARRYEQLLDADNFVYFLYPSPHDTDRPVIHIRVNPYSDNVAMQLTREANAVPLLPMMSTDIMDITPLVARLPNGKWMLSAIFQPAPTYTGAVLWNGLLRSPGFPVERR